MTETTVAVLGTEAVLALVVAWDLMSTRRETESQVLREATARLLALQRAESARGQPDETAVPRLELTNLDNAVLAPFPALRIGPFAHAENGPAITPMHGDEPAEDNLVDLTANGRQLGPDIARVL